MGNEIIRSITLYGEIVDNKQEWLSWYNKAKKLVNLLGYEANYFSVEGGNMRSGKVLTVKRSEKKLLDTIKCSDGIKWLSVCCLPTDYKSASFDYKVFLSRHSDYVTFMAIKNELEKFNDNKLVCLLKEHIKMEKGEIYDMEQSEFPFIYAAKLNSISSFKTLKIIKTIQG